MGRNWRAVGRYDALVTVAGIWFLAKFLRYTFPPLFEELQLAFGVSNAALGASFTGFMLTYAAMQFPSGLLADRFGSVRVITAGLLTALGGAVLVALGGPFVSLVVAMLVMGAGTGAHKTVAIKLLSEYYPARTGRTLGVFDTLGTFGGVGAPVAVAVVLGYGLGWRPLFVFASILGLVLAVALVARVGGKVSDSRPGSAVSPPLRAYVAPFRDLRFATFVTVTLAFGFAYNGVVAFLPLYLVREASLSSAAASVLYSVLFVVSFVQILTGELADRVGRLTVVAGTLGVATVSLLVLLVGPVGAVTPFGIPVVAGVAVVGFGLGSHGFRPVRGVHLTTLLPESLAGGGLGAVRTGLMGAGAVGPVVVGAIVDAAGFGVAFGVLLGSLSVAVLLASILLVSERQAG